MEPGAPRAVSGAPPFGHVTCREKWRNSALVQRLRGEGVSILFEDEVAVADFQLPDRTRILYVSESDLIAASSHRRDLVRFRNASSSSFLALVLVEKTPLSQQHFNTLQTWVVLDLGLSLLPVGGQVEASQLITRMVQAEGRDNPFRTRTSCQILDPLVLAVVQQIPGVGRVKALALLQTFPSIREICDATAAQLEPVVGRAAARQIHTFFHAETGTGT